MVAALELRLVPPSLPMSIPTLTGMRRPRGLSYLRGLLARDSNHLRGLRRVPTARRPMAGADLPSITPSRRTPMAGL